ncbi:putative lysine decarboxylase [Planctomycetes bacterium Poly30]|uniref:AMP nucleosidase n=1 Tax=Saltatorellus ferox TaxID=2528018 RepID=A0A518EWU1_9BACT|nr:putative lysine decarboxylase [Planctomycetes bacterium Poly30]
MASSEPSSDRAILLNSPSYRQADQDPEFLAHGHTRGVRLHLDYLKAQLLLEEHGIQHTIVVFGSTRIPDPEMARRSLDEARAAHASAPDDEGLERKVAVAERLRAKSRYYDLAREFGRLVSVASGGPDDCSVVIATGGGPGIMEAANRGAFDVGAKSIGFNITLPHEQFPNPYITPGLCFRFHYFAIRKLHFLLRAKALVVFPGGYGTLDELFETLALIQTRKIEPVPVVLIGRSYWREIFNVDFLVDEGVIDAEDRDLFWFAETAKEAWDGILLWHESAGTPPCVTP